MHFSTLRLLRDHGDASQRCLADALRLDPSNLVALLNHLERMECITRQRDAGDRRRHVVNLTAKGQTTLADAERQFAQAEHIVFHGLSTEERSLLHSLLERAAGAHFPD